MAVPTAVTSLTQVVYFRKRGLIPLSTATNNPTCIHQSARPSGRTGYNASRAVRCTVSMILRYCIESGISSDLARFVSLGTEACHITRSLLLRAVPSCIQLLPSAQGCVLFSCQLCLLAASQSLVKCFD